MFITEPNGVAGVYGILNIKTGKMYVGSSVDIARRWYQHRWKLRRNEHDNRHLQNAWNKHGEESFAFYVLCRGAPPGELNSLETWAMLEFRRNDGVYNLAPVGGSNLGIKLPPMSEERKRRIGEAQRGRVKSPEERQKLSQAHRGKKLSPESIAKLSVAMRGRKHSEETKRKMSRAATGRPKSAEHRKKISDALRGRKTGRPAANRGQHHTDEARKKMSIAGKGRPKSSETRAKMRAAQLRRREREREEMALTR